MIFFFEVAEKGKQIVEKGIGRLLSIDHHQQKSADISVLVGGFHQITLSKMASTDRHQQIVVDKRALVHYYQHECIDRLPGTRHAVHDSGTMLGSRIEEEDKMIYL